MSANGFMTVTWNYTHTGGLPLTNILVSYIKQLEGLNVNLSTLVSENEVDATSVEVPNLEAGFGYIFNITAVSNHSSSSIFCGPTLHVNGGCTCNYMYCDPL